MKKRMGEIKDETIFREVSRGSTFDSRRDEAAQTLFSEEVTDSEIAAFMVGLNQKGKQQKRLLV